MIDVHSLKEGDVFFNKERSHIAIVKGISNRYLVYVWKAIAGRDNWTNVECKVSKEDAIRYAIHWHTLSSLEKELL